jgi:hypothetical protein
MKVELYRWLVVDEVYDRGPAQYRIAAVNEEPGPRDEEGASRLRYVLYFDSWKPIDADNSVERPQKRKLGLNIDNTNALVDAYGDETDNWTGHIVICEPGRTMYNRQERDCITVKPLISTPKERLVLRPLISTLPYEFKERPPEDEKPTDDSMKLPPEVDIVALREVAGIYKVPMLQISELARKVGVPILMLRGGRYIIRNHIKRVLQNQH